MKIGCPGKGKDGHETHLYVLPFRKGETEGILRFSDHHDRGYAHTGMRSHAGAWERDYNHHERWDGSGYPAGLATDSIPLSGRLMALADVYDALINKRVYKEAFTHEKSMEIIIKGRGKHFDPDIVDAFIEKEKEFHEIARKFRS